MSQESQLESFQCVICLEENLSSREKEVFLPCCGKESRNNSNNNNTNESYIRYCSDCITTLANNDRENCFRCPTCRRYLKVEFDENSSSAETTATTASTPTSSTENNKNTRIRISMLNQGGNCRLCGQVRTIIHSSCCEACLLGWRYKFSYECDRCHQFQLIPHPMWRYQRTAREFSGETWACHRCGDYTHWRIAAGLISQIPLFDVPISWNMVRQDELLNQMRNQIREQIVRAPLLADVAHLQQQQNNDFPLMIQQYGVFRGTVNWIWGLINANPLISLIVIGLIFQFLFQ